MMIGGLLAVLGWKYGLGCGAGPYEALPGRLAGSAIYATSATVRIDGNGLAYVSGFATGTMVWNTATRQFVRGPNDAVCASVDLSDPTSACRGAFAATADRSGSVYQVFFGDSFQTLPPAVFVFDPVSFALRDSIAAGVGPSSLDIAVFGN